MAKVAAAGLLVALGTIAAYATVGSAGADPPLNRPATVYRTVVRTETVHTRVEGHGARWWAHRARSNGRAMRAQRITLQRIRRSLRASLEVGASGLEQAFLCIHHFEGSWTDTGAPYYGGLQMDWDFMRTYGAPFLRAYGPAANWTPAMQIATAERAYLEGRGFGPWPNTARMCGLR